MRYKTYYSQKVKTLVRHSNRFEQPLRLLLNELNHALLFTRTFCLQSPRQGDDDEVLNISQALAAAASASQKAEILLQGDKPGQFQQVAHVRELCMCYEL